MHDRLSKLSDSLREPQLEPSDTCITILQDHGPDHGGWGPAAAVLPWTIAPAPIAYTGSQEEVIETLGAVAAALAIETGKPTILARFTHREDIETFGGST